jgi:hypothetical protein
VRLAIKSLLFFVVAVVAISMSSPTSAFAHGLGGAQAQDSTSDVTAIAPETDEFSIRTIEHGERIEVIRTSEKDIVILGVDNEPYILINNDGVFENDLSATRIINESTSYEDPQSRLEEFEDTSGDPDTPPEWKKVSESQTYRYHDHRAHYMGSTDNITDLGTSTIPVRAGDTLHSVEFTLTAQKSPSWVLYGIVFLVASAAMIVIAKNKNFAPRFFSNISIIVMSCVIAIAEIVHVYGYFAFTYESLSQEITGSIFSLSVVFLAVATAVVFFVHRTIDAETNWNRHAPLLCMTGFIGFVAGAAAEYNAFLKPYLPTTLNYTLVRLVITGVGVICIALLTLGLSHVTSSSTSTLATTEKDSPA